jgi:hypothetical protein
MIEQGAWGAQSFCKMIEWRRGLVREARVWDVARGSGTGARSSSMGAHGSIAHGVRACVITFARSVFDPLGPGDG